MADKPAEDNEYEITTTAQVERTYKVKGKDGEHAHKRLRRWLEDPEMARPDLIEVLADRQEDTSPQRVKKDSIKQVQKPRAVEEKKPGAAAAGAAS